MLSGCSCSIWSPWELWDFSPHSPTEPTLLGMLVLVSGTQLVGLIHQLWVLTIPLPAALPAPPALSHHRHVTEQGNYFQRGSVSQSSASAMAPVAMRLMATAWDEAKSCDPLSQSEERWTFSWGPAGMPHQWPCLPHSLGILHLGTSI